MFLPASHQARWQKRDVPVVSAFRCPAHISYFKPHHKQLLKLTCCTATPLSAADASNQAALDSSAEKADSHAQEWWKQPNMPAHIGPVELKVVEGKGRCVITTRDVKLGELLLCIPPIAIVNTPVGQARASAESLVDHIVDDRLWQRAWFQALYDGTPKSCTECPDLSMPVDTAGQESLPTLTTNTSCSDVKRSAAGFAVKAGKAAKTGRNSKVAVKTLSGPASAALEAAGLNKKALRRIAQITKYNCYGDNHEDLALCEMRSEPPRGHIGVWGQFAMLNHSCAPNAINYCVGDNMVVRAAQPMACGEEVTISYLGRPQLTPVGARRVLLKDDYGFMCDCTRCTLELQHIDKLDTSQYEELHLHASNRLRQGFETARQQADTSTLEDIYHELEAHLVELSSQFRKTLVSPKARLYIQASLYEAYELMVEVCNALERSNDTAYWQNQVVRFLEAVTPGSDLHNIVASQYHAICTELHGEDSTSAQQAWALVKTAVTARYGTVSRSSAKELAVLNRTLYK